MKKIFLLLLVLAHGVTKSQTDQDSVKLKLNQYFDLLRVWDNEKAIEYVYPAIFNFVEKEKLVEAMNTIKNNPAVDITLTEAKTQSLSNTMESSGSKYILVNYSFVYTMKFKQDLDNEKMEFMYDSMKEKYGKKNVKFDKKNKTFHFTQGKKLYAINDPVYKSWKFLEKNDQQPQLMEQLVPEEVLKKLQ